MLHASKNVIADLTPLKELPLVELELDDNFIHDISPLENISGLTNLSLSKNNISDISPLRNKKELETLDLDLNDIDDVSPLVDSYKLEFLSIARNHVADIKPLMKNNIYNFYASMQTLKGIDPSVFPKGYRFKVLKGDSKTEDGKTIYSEDSIIEFNYEGKRYSIDYDRFGHTHHGFIERGSYEHKN